MATIEGKLKILARPPNLLDGAPHYIVSIYGIPCRVRSREVAEQVKRFDGQEVLATVEPENKQLVIQTIQEV